MTQVENSRFRKGIAAGQVVLLSRTGLGIG